MTKMLVLEEKDVFERHAPAELYECCEITLMSQFTPVKEILACASDTEILLANPTISVKEDLIDGLPNLQLIQTEGVGFEGVDLNAANKRGIYVCNCRGVNARAVAEHTVMLMLCCLRDVINGYQDVLEGRQNDKKVYYMKTGSLRELGDCTVGFIGYGAIGKEAAKLISDAAPEGKIYTIEKSTEQPLIIRIRLDSNSATHQIIHAKAGTTANVIIVYESSADSSALSGVITKVYAEDDTKLHISKVQLCGNIRRFSLPSSEHHFC